MVYTCDRTELSKMLKKKYASVAFKGKNMFSSPRFAVNFLHYNACQRREFAGYKGVRNSMPLCPDKTMTRVKAQNTIRKFTTSKLYSSIVDW